MLHKIMLLLLAKRYFTVKYKKVLRYEIDTSVCVVVAADQYSGSEIPGAQDVLQ
jgi:hypothetical protein